jgi:hypothetical protein
LEVYEQHDVAVRGFEVVDAPGRMFFGELIATLQFDNEFAFHDDVREVVSDYLSFVYNPE